MKLSKIILLATFLIVSKSACAKATYIPSHLEQFKQIGICVNCDLSEAEIYAHDNVDLTNALLVKTNFKGHFYVSNFTHAQLMYANLGYAQFSGSNFSSANLTGAYLVYSNFSSCNFDNANLTGANLAYANFARSTISIEQLSQAQSIDCAILPEGTRHPRKDGGAC